MSNARTDSLELETQLAEAINNFFETARRCDFFGAQGVTYLATTLIEKRGLFGGSRQVREEKRTHSLAYELHSAASDFEDGLSLAVEGTFIQIPPSHSMEWPFSIHRPRATENLIREINITASRIAP